MRIGVDARLIHHQPAGIGKYTQNLLLSYAKQQNDVIQGFDFNFLVFQHRRHVNPIVDHSNFERVTLYSPVQTKIERFSLPVELLLHPVDLLHCPDFIPPRYSSTPAVITVHDLAFLHWPHFLTESSAAYYGQIDRCVHRAKHVIVPSESTKQDLVRLLGVPDDHVSVIYEAANPRFCPLPQAETYQETKKKYNLPQNYILYVGTVEPRKNIEGLLHAFRHLINKYHVSDTALVIAGGFGWLYDEILQLVEELDLGNLVQLLGRVPDDALHKLYVGARCHVHVAHYEGFGLTPLESMACGTPTIVSNVSSLPEVVGDAALLVDPNEAEEIAIAMHRLLTNDELHDELREKGFQRAACFSWDEAARQTLLVYQSVLETIHEPLPESLANPNSTNPDLTDQKLTRSDSGSSNSSAPNSAECALSVESDSAQIVPASEINIVEN